MGESLLSAVSLTKRFPQGNSDVEILHGISLEVAKGEIVAIMGPSGAGKSTLLHILGLMEQPTSGTLSILGQDVQRLTTTQRAQRRNQTLGFLFQFHHLLPELNVIENVLLPAKIGGHGHQAVESRALALLDSMGLTAQLQQKPATLSGGEQQRTALARALINEPALLLADEPTGNLDNETGERVLSILWEESRRRQAALIIVTHQEDIARRADRIIRLRSGRIETSLYKEGIQK